MNKMKSFYALYIAL